MQIAGYKFVKKQDINENIKQEIEYQKVYNYLGRYDATLQVTNQYNINNKVAENKTIWLFWMQGIHTAPKLVQSCIESIIRCKPSDFDLIVLSEENVKQYVMLPDFVWDKYEKGIITLTHLSDILRLELLYQYGGCWVDATVYCSDTIPEYMLHSDFFMFKWSNVGGSVLKGSSWWMCAKKGERIISDARNLLNNYWKREDKLRNYFLLHIILSKVINESSFNRSTFQGMPDVCNSNPHVLWENLQKEFDEEKWKIIKSHSTIHKLSYKKRFIQGDVYNYYMALLDSKLV